MKIERLRKSHKKQIIIGAVAICIVGGALTFNLTKAKYKLIESIPLVRGTVNYKVPDLRTVALYTANDSGVYQETNDIPTSGYGLNKEKSVCKVYDGTTSVENAPVDSSITIEYKNGKVNFLGISKRNTRCYLYFDKKNTITVAFGDIEIQEEIPSFSKTSCTSGCEETTVGIYKTEDGMYGGNSYYWRGDPTDNYIKFAGFCWRIIRINGDKTIRLIYDGATCHANGTSTKDSIAVEAAYSSSYNQSNYVGWTYTGTSQRTTVGTASKTKTQLESWYSSNIGNNTNYNSKVADGKYCNDRNAQTGQTWNINGNAFNYAAHKRVMSDHTPTLNCSSEDIYTLKVGLITIDEINFAGGSNLSNEKYFLRNGQNYWTMSPEMWNYNTAYVFYINGDGCFSYTNRVSNNSGLRPVINLRSDVTFQSGGNGTQSNPYVVQ